MITLGLEKCRKKKKNTIYLYCVTGMLEKVENAPIEMALGYASLLGRYIEKNQTNNKP